MLLQLLSRSKDFWLPDMTRRLDVAEANDKPIPDTNTFNAALDHFALVNLLFERTRGMVNSIIIKKMLSQPGRRYTFLNLGAEGCESGRWLLDACTRLRLNAHVTCVDQNPRVIEHAVAKYGLLDNMLIIEGRAVDLLSSGKKFDFIFANHFLHHVPQNSVAGALKLIDTGSQCGFLVHDLTRSKLWYALFTLFASLFLQNSSAFYDGRISIRRGFQKQELKSLVRQAGLSGVRIKTTFPGQFYIYRFAG